MTEVILAHPRGFCAGVERAVKVVERALELYPSKEIYVFHEIVHNKYILSDFKSRGVHFVESVDVAPKDCVFIFSAHGVSKEVINLAKNKIDIVIDATCPLVSKVHKEAQRNELEGREIILIGHKGHQEVIGTTGQVNSEIKLVESVADVQKLQVNTPYMLSYITQTTLSVDDTAEIISALKGRFPEIKGPNLKDICYATQNRQHAVKNLAKLVDIILVIGSKNSSNSMRLKEIARSCDVPAYLIDNKDCIDLLWLENTQKIGITAGASAPEILVQSIINFLKEKCANVRVSTMPGIDENVQFKLPKMQF